MTQIPLSSDFLQYLASSAQREQDGDDRGRLPSLSELSKELGMSVAGLREQLEVAKAMGLVEVRPRTGIRRLPYTFLPAIRQSLSYALKIDRGYFEAYTELRNHVEASFWDEAVRKLTAEDHKLLKALVDQAWKKLRGAPIQIPQEEHRLLHLSIFARLENPFVQGILEAYWEAYEAVGLNMYADYGYLEQVWNYHQAMVEAIIAGNFAAGYKALVDHKDLLFHRPELPSGRRPASESKPAIFE